MLPLDSHCCESGGTDAPTVTDNPTQGRTTTPNHARPHENTTAPQPSVTGERSSDNGTGLSSYTNEEVLRTAPLEEEPLCNDEAARAYLLRPTTS